jgi:uncharacterized protein (DUF305 family)
MTMHSHAEHPRMNHYVRLLLMMMASFVAMYALMYAMVDRAPNAYHNLNQVYMAALMTAAMAIIELALMWRMYHRKTWNVTIVAAATLVLLVSWVCIRRQAGIGDRQFLRSMIPHHAGAILMCEQASIRDPDIRRLCESIVVGQQAEIDQMTAKLRELNP